MNLEHRKRLREKANRARRALLKEKSTYGSINDGSGKRYLVGVYYVLAGEIDKALEYNTWFDQEFDDDIGEPICDLFRALAHYRAGNTGQASVELQRAMIQNVYLLPRLIGEPLDRQLIWHWSNQAEPDYLDLVEEFLDEPTTEEREWIKREFHGERFTRLRTAYLETYAALQNERSVPRRSQILDRWRRTSRSFFD